MRREDNRLTPRTIPKKALRAGFLLRRLLRKERERVFQRPCSQENAWIFGKLPTFYYCASDSGISWV